MVPLPSLRIPRARRYSGYCFLTFAFTYMIITFSDRPSHAVRLASVMEFAVLTPGVLLLPVWPLPLSLAATHRISFDFSSSGYLDVSVPRVPHVNLCIQLTFHDSSSWWFPNSEICGSKLICSSPQLIAACHVLHRLLMPRHSLYALVRLNFCRYHKRISLFSSSLELLCITFYSYFSYFVIISSDEILVFVTCFTNSEKPDLFIHDFFLT